MEDVVKRGTGTLAKLKDRPVAGKTGTSDKSRDVWFIGFTPDLSVAIWGGNDHNTAINSKWVTGGAIVAKVWKRFCEAYYEDKEIIPGRFFNEVNMKIVLIDPLTGLLATQYTPNPVKKLFVPGTEPEEYAPVPRQGVRRGTGTAPGTGRCGLFPPTDGGRGQRRRRTLPTGHLVPHHLGCAEQQR